MEVGFISLFIKLRKILLNLIQARLLIVAPSKAFVVGILRRLCDTLYKPWMCYYKILDCGILRHNYTKQILFTRI